VTLPGLDYGLIGIYLLIVCAVAIVVEMALGAFWSFRIAGHANTLNERLTSERANLEAEVERLRMALDETIVLWRPYKRLLWWLQHPLAIALVQSFMRRRAAARTVR
jgi:hypothetical protein